MDTDQVATFPGSSFVLREVKKGMGRCGSSRCRYKFAFPLNYTIKVICDYYLCLNTPHGINHAALKKRNIFTFFSTYYFCMPICTGAVT